MCAAAWEQGILPRGNCIADNNPAMIEAIVAYRAGCYDKHEREMEKGQRDKGGDVDDLPESTRREMDRLTAEGKTVAKPTGRRRKRKRKR